MSKSIKKTIIKLEEKGNRGVSVHDFMRGFRLSARIKDLRNMGYKIQTRIEAGSLAHYVLISRPKV